MKVKNNRSTLEKKLINSIKYLSPEDIEKIKVACDFSASAHSGQKRISGEEYITHPLNVAISLANLSSDPETIIAGLLHDVVEDTEFSCEDISREFGDRVAKLVDGVTKISQIKDKKKILKLSYFHDYSEQIDNYRKVLAAMAGDPRVIIIKLHDRLHNAQTLNWLSGERKVFYALETIEIYAAVADRLGMGEIHGQLCDLSFPHAYPDEYKKFIEVIRPIQKIRQQNVEDVITEVNLLLKNESIGAEINGRVKRDYSLYKKLQIYNFDLAKIYDFIAVRIIVDSLSDCYKTLGIIHANYQPIEHKITDYIARPKENGYQSLHTVVKKDGFVFEVQIRTDEMHQNAEYGIAAHWKYKDSEYKNNRPNIKSELSWLEEISQSIPNGYKLENGKKFFSSKVFVFSPNGKIFELPTNSTPIDFAFLVHTDIGLSCTGAKINGKLLPLDTKLKTGDVVEIIKSDKPKPSRDWLNFVQTTQAKNKIKNFFFNLEKPRLIKDGQKKVADELARLGLPQLTESNFNKYSLRLHQSRLPYENIDSAFASIAKNDQSIIDFLRVILDDQEIGKDEKISKYVPKGSISLGIGQGIPYKIARCCKPKISDDIIGYITLQQKITVHKKSCAETKKFSKQRIISAKWQ